MILAGLADILRTELLDDGVRQQVIRALNSGLRYYLNAFVSTDGGCREIAGRSTPAEIAGYCEGGSHCARSSGDIGTRRRSS